MMICTFTNTLGQSVVKYEWPFLKLLFVLSHLQIIPYFKLDIKTYAIFFSFFDMN